MTEELTAEYDKILSTYYKDEKIRTIISLKVETKNADIIAEKVAEFKNVDEVFIVTGDVDIILKATFENYKDMKEFILNSLGTIEGVKDTKTMMVVASYKELGVKR